ncbi:MAG: hypothetical protein WC884_03690 [Candidatus Paceibacterota bacterium]
MIILLKVFSILLFVFFAGFGIVGLLSFKAEDKKQYFYLIPVVGYVFTQLLFWLFYYFLENSVISFYATIISVVSVNLCLIFRVIKKTESLKRFFSDYLPRPSEILKILFVLFAVFIVSSWQYVLIGEGNYYHSGNEDYFDGIIGGTNYLRNVPLNLMEEDFAINFPVQYSSQTFWHFILSNDWVDGFLQQAILNLFLTIIGVYWLTRYVFKASNNTALWAGFGSVTAHLYLSTYMNGHVGSMMYLAMVPVLLGILLKWGRGEFGFAWLLLGVIFFITIYLTYPGPVYFVLIPAVVLIFVENVIIKFNVHTKFLQFLGIGRKDIKKISLNKLKWFRIILLGIVIITLGIAFTVWIYYYFEPRRISAILRTNVSWKISLFKEMLMIYWGIYPAGSTGTLSILPIIISNYTINTIALILALIVTSIFIWAALSSISNKSRHFLLYFFIFFFPFLIMMRYFWGSPYYFYKFLYTNIFLIVIILFLWIFELSKSKRIIRKSVIILFIFVGSLNLVWNLSLGYDFYTRIYNQKDRVTNFIKYMKNNQFHNVSLNIPNYLYNLVFSYIFNKNGIDISKNVQTSDYIIRAGKLHDVYYDNIHFPEVIYDNGILSIQNHLKSNNATSKSLYPPEFNGSININWIGNNLSLQKGIIDESVLEVINHIKQAGLPGKVFIDIFVNDPQTFTYTIINDMFIKNNVPIQKNPNYADYLLRLKGGVNDVVFKTLFKSANRTIWKNDFFEIVSLPKENRQINEVFDKLDYTQLFNIIKKNGNKIYFDIPDDDFRSLYIKQEMKSAGIEIVENSNLTSLICRYNFYPSFTDYNNYKISNPREKVLLKIERYQMFNRINPWRIELVESPLTGRSFVKRKNIVSFRDRQMLGQDRSDYIIDISNISNKAKFIRFIVAPGPSIDFSKFQLRINTLENIFNKTFIIESPITKIDIPIDSLVNNNSSNTKIFLESKDLFGNNLVGHSLLPLEERYLLYEIRAIEITDNVKEYSDNIVKVLNSSPQSRIDLIFRDLFNLPRNSDIIAPSDSNRILLGMGWNLPENFEDQTFRWIGKDNPEIILNNNNILNNTLEIELEPGPGSNLRPLNLQVYIADSLIENRVIKQREKIDINLPKEITSKRNQTIIKLVTSTENKKIGTDPRILNYRVFNVSLKNNEKLLYDIIKANDRNQIYLGDGWYPFETYDGKSFQWVGKEPAEIIFKNSDNNLGTIKLDLEPGPSCGGEPLKLNVYLNKKKIDEYKLLSKKTLEIDLKKNKNNVKNGNNIIKLVPSSKNIIVPGDPRILNFRVFNINYMQQ